MARLRCWLPLLAAVRVAADDSVVVRRSLLAFKEWEEARATCPEGTFLQRCESDPADAGNGVFPSADARACVVVATTEPVSAVAHCSSSEVAALMPPLVLESDALFLDQQEVAARCGDEDYLTISCNCHSLDGSCEKSSWQQGCSVRAKRAGGSARRRYTELGAGIKVYAICRGLTVTSLPSQPYDDAKAVAQCPMGTWVHMCEALSDENDGALPSQDGRACVAVTQWGRQGVMARAVCAAKRTYAMPSSGGYLAGEDLEARCTGGEASWCTCESKWGIKDNCGGVSDFEPSGGVCRRKIPGSTAGRRRRGGARIHAICTWPAPAPSACGAASKGRGLRRLSGLGAADFQVRLHCGEESYRSDIYEMRNALGGAWMTEEVRPAGEVHVRLHAVKGLEIMLTVRMDSLQISEIRTARDGVPRLHVELRDRKSYVPPRGSLAGEFPADPEDMPRPGVLSRRLFTDALDDGSPEKKTWFLPFLASMAVTSAARFDLVFNGVASLLGNGVAFFETGWDKGFLPLSHNWERICKGGGNNLPQRLAVPLQAVPGFAVPCKPEALFATEEGRCEERRTAPRRLVADEEEPLDFV